MVDVRLPVTVAEALFVAATERVPVVVFVAIAEPVGVEDPRVLVVGFIVLVLVRVDDPERVPVRVADAVVVGTTATAAN